MGVIKLKCVEEECAIDKELTDRCILCLGRQQLEKDYSIWMRSLLEGKDTTLTCILGGAGKREVRYRLLRETKPKKIKPVKTENVRKVIRRKRG